MAGWFRLLIGLLVIFFSLGKCSSEDVSPVAEFTSCGSDGPIGPKDEQCKSLYGNEIVSNFKFITVNGIQFITVPFSGIYRIEAFGAAGVSTNGGKGAFVGGDFPLPQGAVLRLLVGQQGEDNATIESYGGSGGSFVFRSGNTEPMLVAGGGTTPPSGSGSSSVVDASADRKGKNASDTSDGIGTGGDSGEGGYSSKDNKGGGGAGFRTSGFFSGPEDPSFSPAQPFLFESTPTSLIAGRGGTVSDDTIIVSAGGFGGGGYGLANSSGGGGGYSGGGGATEGAFAGGGGSFSSGLNPRTAVDNSGEGKITVQYIGSGIVTKCSETSYEVSFYKELVYGITNFTFIDQSCKSQTNESHVIMTSGLNECGTVASMNSSHVFFNNTIKEVKDLVRVVGSRYIINNFAISCLYSVRDIVSLNILPEIDVLNFIPKPAEGTFLLSMRAYNSSAFEGQYSSEDFPLIISTKSNVFLEIGLSFKNEFEELELLLEECYVSPTENDSEEPKHSLIENGCVADETLEYFPSVDSTTRRFMFKAISFTNANLTTAFVHCKALLCNSSEPSRCKEGCKRSKRSTPTDVVKVERLTDLAESAFHEGSVNGAIGPFVVEDGEPGRPQPVDEVLIIVSSTLSAALAITLISLLIFALYAKGAFCKKSTEPVSRRDEVSRL